MFSWANVILLNFISFGKDEMLKTSQKLWVIIKIRNTHMGLIETRLILIVLIFFSLKEKNARVYLVWFQKSMSLQNFKFHPFGAMIIQLIFLQQIDAPLIFPIEEVAICKVIYCINVLISSLNGKSKYFVSKENSINVKSAPHSFVHWIFHSGN